VDDIGFHAHNFIGRKGFRPLGSEDGHLTTFFSKRLSELIGIISHATNVGRIRSRDYTNFQNYGTILIIYILLNLCLYFQSGLSTNVTPMNEMITDIINTVIIFNL